MLWFSKCIDIEKGYSAVAGLAESFHIHWGDYRPKVLFCFVMAYGQGVEERQGVHHCFAIQGHNPSEYFA